MGLGALAIAFYVIHAVDQIVHRHAEDVLWVCHVACLLVGLGCLGALQKSGVGSGSRASIAIGVSWLAVGIPLWALDLGTGGSFIPTSALTHLGGFVIGFVALRRLGWPRRVWWKAVLAQCALLALTRLVTPPRANVNLAFAVWDGWERYFPSYASYFVLLFTVSAAAFAVVDRAMRCVFVPRKELAPR